MILENKIALVTGAGSGLGQAIAQQFAAEGAQVAVADLNLEAAQNTAETIAPIACAIEVDVTRRSSVQAMTDSAELQLGPIDILVNCAGVSYVTPSLECSEELWDKTIDINLKGTFNCCQSLLRRMAPRNQGCIINMSSQSGKAGNSQYAAYCASKFGVIGLTQSLALEFAPQNIRINALCPGVVFTPLWDNMLADYARKRNMKPEEVEPYFKSKIPLGRLCQTQDVAHTAVFLASDQAAYLTGQSLNITGGAVMH